MATTKLIEIRDSMTFISAIATQLDPANERERVLLARSGFGLRPGEQSKYVFLARLNGGTATYDPYDWGDRTMAQAHQWLAEHFGEIESGDVVDVEFILGETAAPKEPEGF